MSATRLAKRNASRRMYDRLTTAWRTERRRQHAASVEAASPISPLRSDAAVEDQVDAREQHDDAKRLGRRPTLREFMRVSGVRRSSSRRLEQPPPVAEVPTDLTWEEPAAVEDRHGDDDGEPQEGKGKEP